MVRGMRIRASKLRVNTRPPRPGRPYNRAQAATTRGSARRSLDSKLAN